MRVSPTAHEPLPYKTLATPNAGGDVTVPK
jgi:hypothetical protein